MKKLSKIERDQLMQTITNNIKKYRKAKGLTQEQLAEKLNSSVNFIGKIEAKSHQGISLETAYIIAKELDIPLNELFIDTKEIKSEIKAVKYKCNKCGLEINIPVKAAIMNSYLNKINDNNNIPYFDCTNCDGKLYPLNPNDL